MTLMCAILRTDFVLYEICHKGFSRRGWAENRARVDLLAESPTNIDGNRSLG